jgi:ankyrin repeat protein
MLQNGLDIDFVFPPTPNYGLTFMKFSPSCLCVAAYYNSERCLRFLLTRGADVTATDAHGNSPASYAASGGSLTVLSLLIDYNASLNGALEAAAKSPSFTAFVWLYSMTELPVGFNQQTSETMLHAAACGGDARIISLLLKRPDSDVNALTEFVVLFLRKFLL